MIAPHPEHETPIETSTPPLFRQLALQASAALTVLSLAWPYFGLRDEILPWPETALAIGATAWILARITRQALWWQLIHACFVPLAWVVSLLNIGSGWFFLAFVVLLLFFRGAVHGQIPLYLTNITTIDALIDLLESRPKTRFADLGAGIGSTVAPLCRALPSIHATGIENAPASWLIGWLRTRRLPRATWRMDDLWRVPLGEFDVVYAFLSPVPMPELWKKVQREMTPGSLFISNSFAIPDVEADEVLELDDGRQTRLYCYQIPATVDRQIKVEYPAD